MAVTVQPSPMNTDVQVCQKPVHGSNTGPMSWRLAIRAGNAYCTARRTVTAVDDGGPGSYGVRTTWTTVGPVVRGVTVDEDGPGRMAVDAELAASSPILEEWPTSESG